MSYDITFIRPVPGLTIAEAVRERNAGDAGIPPLDLSSEQSAAWLRIAQRVGDEVGRPLLDTGDKWVSLEVADDPYVGLDYWGESAAIRLPFRFDDAAGAVGRAYRVAWIVEQETGLTGFDPQTELELGEANLPAAVAHYERTMAIMKEWLPPRR